MIVKENDFWHIVEIRGFRLSLRLHYVIYPYGKYFNDSSLLSMTYTALQDLTLTCFPDLMSHHFPDHFMFQPILYSLMPQGLCSSFCPLPRQCSFPFYPSLQWIT